MKKHQIDPELKWNRMVTADELQDKAQVYCARTRTTVKMKGGAK